MQVIQQKAAGGVIITSSHNPVQWNGLKFVDSNGLFLDPALCDQLFTMATNLDGISYSGYDKPGKLQLHSTAIEEHIDLILSLPYLKLDQIRNRRFKVCLDAINGSCFESDIIQS